MQKNNTIDVGRSAVLIMDFQNEIVSNVAHNPHAVIANASRVLGVARNVGLPVIYVVHRGGRFEQYSPGVEIHSGVEPKPGERIITKTKAGPFSTTGLDVMLREMGVDTLIMMGVATSGCVLSATRWANDLNYKVLVIGEACDDRDPEVHRILVEEIFSRQGVLTVEEFISAIT